MSVCELCSPDSASGLNNKGNCQADKPIAPLARTTLRLTVLWPDSYLPSNPYGLESSLESFRLVGHTKPACMLTGKASNLVSACLRILAVRSGCPVYDFLLLSFARLVPIQKEIHL